MQKDSIELINIMTLFFKKTFYILKLEKMTIEKIENNEVYKEILKDSFGGVMYNVANQNKYDTKELLELWNSLEPYEKESVGGIMKWAMNFIQWK